MARWGLPFPSPLAGEGCAGLANESELSRSWMGGGAPIGARARKSAIVIASWLTPVRIFDRQRSRAARLRRGPLIHPRALSTRGSLRSPRLRILPPRGGQGAL